MHIITLVFALCIYIYVLQAMPCNPFMITIITIMTLAFDKIDGHGIISKGGMSSIPAKENTIWQFSDRRKH